MSRTIFQRRIATVLLALALAACTREAPETEGLDSRHASADAIRDGATEATRPVELVDVVETTPAYVIGISYPPSASEHPLLAAELKRYADAAQAELMQAVVGRPADAAALYDLSLNFTEVADTPQVVAFAADGTSYTGGAHGMPLLARWVWLPQRREMLTAEALVPQRSGWEAVARHVRGQLHAQLSQQLDADELEPAVRAERMESAGRMIDDGTEAVAANFGQFEPVVGPDGRIAALRFVFAPYQVAPYAAGVQAVEVPSAVLLPHVAAEYRPLFTPAPPRRASRLPSRSASAPVAGEREPEGGITST